LVAGVVWDATHEPATAFFPAAFGGLLVLMLAPPLLRASGSAAHASLTMFNSARSGVRHDAAA
jgi:hypothetical protein